METSAKIRKRDRDVDMASEIDERSKGRKTLALMEEPANCSLETKTRTRKKGRDIPEEGAEQKRSRKTSVATEDVRGESAEESASEAEEELLRLNHVPRQALNREADVQVSLELPAVGLPHWVSPKLDALMNADHPKVSLSFFAGPLKGPREIGKVTVWKGRIPAWLTNLVGYHCTEKGLYRSMRAVVQALFVGLSQSNNKEADNAAKELHAAAKDDYRKGWKKAALELSPSRGKNPHRRGDPNAYLESLLVLEGALSYAYAFSRQKDLERRLSGSEPLRDWMRAFWEDLQERLPPFTHVVFPRADAQRYLENRYWDDLDLLCQITLREVHLDFARESEQDSSEEGELFGERSSDDEELSSEESTSDEEDFNEAEW
jgi:hypothetical protein